MAAQNGDYPDTQDQEQETAESPEARQAAQPDAGSDGNAPAAQLQAELAAARAEVEQYKDKYLREYADKENFRKRQERITADRVRSSKREMLERVLDVVDNLERSLTYQETMDANSLRQTLNILLRQLQDVLRDEGLVEIQAVGQPFDPYVHDAIEQVASDEYPEGTVAEEVRKGYRLGDETLRPSRVKVSAGPNA